MTENNNINVLKRELKALPENIKTYLFSDRFDKDIQKISDELSLSEKQKEKTEDVVALRLMGLKDLDNTVMHLQQTFPEEEVFFDVLDRVLSLTDPFVRDIVEINIRHKKEAENNNLKKSVPVPPPNPAPVTENTEAVKNNNTQNKDVASEGLTYNKK